MNTAQLEKEIIKCFTTKKQWYRKEIIKECLKNSDLTKAELNNTNPSSKLIKYSSLIGTQITRLLDSGYLVIDKGKNITLAFENPIVIQNLELEKFVLNLLTRKSHSKKEIIEQCEQFFFKNFFNKQITTSFFKDQVNTILTNLLHKRIITLENQQYQTKRIDHFPNTEIGNCLNDASCADDIYKFFIEAINIKGGEFFEDFVVNLLVRFFRFGKKIVHLNQVTGGSMDNGIDGIIETTDFLGFKERTLIQAKVRRSTHITLKEVRDFYGAQTAENGSHGIFITNSYFHKEALKLINRLPNLVGIDNRKLFELASMCQYGIILKNEKYTLDPNIFL